MRVCNCLHLLGKYNQVGSMTFDVIIQTKYKRKETSGRERDGGGRGRRKKRRRGQGREEKRNITSASAIEIFMKHHSI